MKKRKEKKRKKRIYAVKGGSIFPNTEAPGDRTATLLF